MFEVLNNEILAPNLHRLVVRAPRIAPVRGSSLIRTITVSTVTMNHCWSRS